MQLLGCCQKRAAGKQKPRAHPVVTPVAQLMQSPFVPLALRAAAHVAGSAFVRAALWMPSQG